MKINQVLTESKKLLAEDPHLNSTQLAQAIAGGYKGELYRPYVKTLIQINKLTNRGKLK